MKNQVCNIIATLLMTVLLSLVGGFAVAAPMTPELAARKEMVRKQQEQRITPDKRKAAAEALKAERLKVQKAKETVQQSAPVTSDIK